MGKEKRERREREHITYSDLRLPWVSKLTEAETGSSPRRSRKVAADLMRFKIAEDLKLHLSTEW